MSAPTNEPLPRWLVRGSELSGLPPRVVAAPTADAAVEAYRAALSLSEGAPLTAVPAPDSVVRDPAPGAGSLTTPSEG